MIKVVTVMINGLGRVLINFRANCASSKERYLLVIILQTTALVSRMDMDMDMGTDLAPLSLPLDMNDKANWDWDAEVELPGFIFYFLMTVCSIPVLLFFMLWAWLGWKLFINN
jgi:hypothetical protein